MKKDVWKSAFLACGVFVVTALVAVACDSTDSDGAQYDFSKMEFTFSYEVSEDLLALADITFSYETADEAGVMAPVVETLTATSWEKSFEATTLPADFSVEVRAVPKEGVVLDKTSYQLQYSLKEEFKEYRTNGKVYWTETPDVEQHAVTLSNDPANTAPTVAALAAELSLMNRTFAYVVKVDPEGGYDVEDND